MAKDIEAFVWTPGREPTPWNGQWPPPDGVIVWVDCEAPSASELVAFMDRLQLPQINHQMLWHIATGSLPGTPGVEQVIDGYSADTANALLGGETVAVLSTAEPVFVAFSDQRWSYAAAPLRLLATTRCLITCRAEPFDLRYGTAYDELGPLARELLTHAAHSYTRSDDLPRDVGTMMVAWIAERHVTVSWEIQREVINRHFEFHRALIDVHEADLGELQRQLFDLRWALELMPGAQYCTGIGQRKVHHLPRR